MKGLRSWFVIAACCFLQSCSSLSPSATNRSFTLAIWNIGRFSNGAKSYSTIDIIQNHDIVQQYNTFINKTLNPDVLVINEYNNVFYKDGNGREIHSDSLLFNSFDYKFIGPEWWKCNAIFSKFKIRNLSNFDENVYYFNAHKAINDDVKVSKRDTYVLENIVVVRGRPIKIVSVHIDFSSKASGVYQKAQISELIDRYKDENQVIICGDFNVGKYRQFEEAGYSVANDGSFKTYPSKGYPLDNIIYKGVTVTDVRMYATTLSDHNPLSCRVAFN